ncbi:hypothetical protein [Microbacterium saperdae]|uniref:Uncharacterized protein n=1 Tax=Microbacterium saperdae TaxID=69368 RepID=A0A543BN35_9MICO|nr:hypothetical protein [Microbacterium saperdae]TQL86245.1 hypothetical protein FB560_1895 [Microbacterium saperdae]GGM49492.1 hypothetical protein GCM10010489_21140 [Microbacterium saperdae]
MTTLRDALNATFRLEAIEASFLQAIEGIQAIENTYLSPAENLSRSLTTFTFADSDSPGVIKDAESIFKDGMLHTRTPDGWVAIELDRPAIGTLSLLLLLHGADLDQTLTDDGSPLMVAVDRDRSREHVPDQYRVVLDDLLAGSDITPDGYVPEHLTARIAVAHDPLHICEMSYTNDTIPATFALELHPTARRDIPTPPMSN